MRRQSWRLVLAGFVVVVSAAPAFAECAWVAWIQGVKYSEGKVVRVSQSPKAGYTTRDECMQAIQSWQLDEVERQDSEPTTQFKYRYACLPDTVDPRGPKMK